MMELFYTTSKNEPLITLKTIISKLKLGSNKFKIRFETDLTDTIKLYKTLSFLFEEYNFNTQFETRLVHKDLVTFLNKFFMFTRSNEQVKDFVMEIQSNGVKIKVMDAEKTIQIDAPEEMLKSISTQ